LYEEQTTGTERSGTGEQESRRPQNRLKTLSKLHELFANFAQRITTELSSYSQKIIAQIELELRKSKKFEQERVFPQNKDWLGS
jgi:two-component sensor histidine kinase